MVGFLATVVGALLLLFPSLFVSLGFWLSVSGVFYIFLLLQYSKGYHKWFITLLVIPVGIFLLMLPVVHTVFGTTSSDTALLWLFDLPVKGEDHYLAVWMGVLYVLFSLAAIRYRPMFYLTLGSALAYAGVIFLF